MVSGGITGLALLTLIGSWLGRWEQTWFLPLTVIKQHHLGAEIGFILSHPAIIHGIGLTLLADFLVVVLSGYFGWTAWQKKNYRHLWAALIIGWVGLIVTINFAVLAGFALIIVVVLIGAVVNWSASR